MGDKGVWQDKIPSAEKIGSVLRQQGVGYEMIRNSNTAGNEFFYVIIRAKNDISTKIRFLSWEDWDEIALLVDLDYGMFVDIDVFYPEDIPDSGGYLEVYGDYPFEDFPYTAVIVMKFIEDNNDMVIVDIDHKKDRRIAERHIKEHWKSR